MPSAPGFELLPDAYSVAHDRELTTSAIEEIWSVLHNDSNAVSVSAVNCDANAIGQAITLPSGATLTMDDDGGFLYVPLVGATYTDQFSYSATDGSESASSLVTISVTNAVPIAYDSSLSTRHDQGLRIYPEEFAWDDDFDALLLDVVSAPAAGSLIENEDGTFTYTPPEHWAGTTSLIVRASDGIATSNDAVLTIDVTNSAPVATADEFYLHAGLILSLDATDGLMHNDYDSDWDHLVAEFVGEWPDDGMLTFGPDGAMTYDPEGHIGDVIFEYRLFDGVTYSGTVSVTIHVENEVPQGTPDEWDVWYDQGLSLGSSNVLENDWDDDHDELTAMLVSGPLYAQSFQLNADGSFMYLPEPVTFVLQDTFTYKLFDGTSYSEAIAVTLHFTNSPIAKDDAYVLDENGSVHIDPENATTQGVLKNEFNPMGWSLTAELALPIDPTDPNDPNAPLDPNVGTVDFRSDGSFTFVAGINFQGTVEFSYDLFATVNNQPTNLGRAVVHLVAQPALADSIQLVMVGFHSNALIRRDTANTDYSSDSQWWDVDSDGIMGPSDNQHPSAFTRGRPILLMSWFRVSAQRSTWQGFGDQIRARATGPDGLTVGFNTPIYGSRGLFLRFNLEGNNRVPRQWITSDTPLANETNYYASFELEWEISPDNGRTWFKPTVSNTSRNEVYVTLADPVGTSAPVRGVHAHRATIRHSVFHAGIWGSVGAGFSSPPLSGFVGSILTWINVNDLARKVFAGFQSRTMQRPDGEKLRYMSHGEVFGQTSDQLITSKTGNCAAWSNFLIDVLRAQGANIGNSAFKNIAIAPAGGPALRPQGFLVGRVREQGSSEGNWILAGEANLPAGLPANNPFGYRYTTATQVPTPGAAQNNPMPAASWMGHYVVRIGNVLYDPSYGLLYEVANAANLAEAALVQQLLQRFETVALAGYYHNFMPQQGGQPVVVYRRVDVANSPVLLALT